MTRTLLTLAAMTLLSLNAFADDDLAELTASDISDAAVAIDSLSDGSLDVDALAAKTENKGEAQEACWHGWGGGYGCGYGGYGYGGYGSYGYGCGYRPYSCYQPYFYSCYRPCYTYSYCQPTCYGGYGGYWGCY